MVKAETIQGCFKKAGFKNQTDEAADANDAACENDAAEANDQIEAFLDCQDEVDIDCRGDAMTDNDIIEEVHAHKKHKLEEGACSTAADDTDEENEEVTNPTPAEAKKAKKAYEILSRFATLQGFSYQALLGLDEVGEAV